MANSSNATNEITNSPKSLKSRKSLKKSLKKSIHESIEKSIEKSPVHWDFKDNLKNILKLYLDEVSDPHIRNSKFIRELILKELKKLLNYKKNNKYIYITDFELLKYNPLLKKKKNYKNLITIIKNFIYDYDTCRIVISENIDSNEFKYYLLLFDHIYYSM